VFVFCLFVCLFLHLLWSTCLFFCGPHTTPPRSLGRTSYHSPTPTPRLCLHQKKHTRKNRHDLPLFFVRFLARRRAPASLRPSNSNSPSDPSDLNILADPSDFGVGFGAVLRALRPAAGEGEALPADPNNTNTNNNILHLSGRRPRPDPLMGPLASLRDPLPFLDPDAKGGSNLAIGAGLGEVVCSAPATGHGEVVSLGWAVHAVGSADATGALQTEATEARTEIADVRLQRVRFYGISNNIGNFAAR
jgi:hypothetical protein